MGFPDGIHNLAKKRDTFSPDWDFRGVFWLEGPGKEGATRGAKTLMDAPVQSREGLNKSILDCQSRNESCS